jgi:hypothetical protein
LGSAGWMLQQVNANQRLHTLHIHIQRREDALYGHTMLYLSIAGGCPNGKNPAVDRDKIQP